MGSGLSKAVVGTAFTVLLAAPLGAHADPIFAVTSSNPANGAVLTSAPTSFSVDLSLPYNPLSVQSGDLRIDDVPSSGFLNVDADTLVFSFPLALLPGFHTVAIAAFAIESTSMTLIEAFSARFEIAQVPEPASIALLGLGLAGLGWSRRKRS